MLQGGESSRCITGEIHGIFPLPFKVWDEFMKDRDRVLGRLMDFAEDVIINFVNV